MKSVIVSAIVGALVLTAGPAAAKGKRVKSANTQSGYAYEFDDDALDAVPNGARGERIRIRRGATRAVLIRPRTQFIAELLKSAENL